MDRVRLKGTKPHQLLPNLIEQLYFSHEIGCVDFCANVREFSASYEANPLKFSKGSARTFSSLNLFLFAECGPNNASHGGENSSEFPKNEVGMFVIKKI